MMTKELIYDQYYGAWLPGTGARIYASSDPATADMDYRSYPFDTYGSGRTYYLVPDTKKKSTLFYCITRVIDTPGNRKDSAFAHILRFPEDSGDIYDAMRPDCFVTGTRNILNTRSLDKLKIESDGEEPAFPTADVESLSEILYQMIFGKIDGGKNRIFVQCGTKEQFNEHMRSIAAYFLGLVPRSYAKDIVVGMSETVCPDGLISVFPDSVIPPDDAGLKLTISYENGNGGALRLSVARSTEVRSIKQSICAYFAELWHSTDDKAGYWALFERFVEEYRKYKIQACLTFMARNGVVFANAPEAASLILRQLKSKKIWYYPREELRTLMAAICINAENSDALSKVFDSFAEIVSVVKYDDSAPLLALCLDCLLETGRPEEEAAEQLERIREKNSYFAQLIEKNLTKLTVHRQGEEEAGENTVNGAPDFTEARDDKKKQDSEIFSQVFSDVEEDELTDADQNLLFAADFDKDDDISSFFTRSDRNNSEDFPVFPQEEADDDLSPKPDSSEEAPAVSNNQSDIDWIIGDDEEMDLSDLLDDVSKQLGAKQRETLTANAPDKAPLNPDPTENPLLLEAAPQPSDNPADEAYAGEEPKEQELEDISDLFDSHSPSGSAAEDSDPFMKELPEMDYSRESASSAHLAAVSNYPGNEDEDEDEGGYFNQTVVNVTQNEVYESDRKSDKSDRKSDKSSKSVRKSGKEGKSSQSDKKNNGQKYQKGNKDKKEPIETPISVNTEKNHVSLTKTDAKNPVMALTDAILDFISKHKNIIEFFVSLVIVLLVFAIGMAFSSQQFNFNASLISIVIFGAWVILIEKIANPGVKLKRLIFNTKTFSSLLVLFLYIVILKIFLNM